MISIVIPTYNVEKYIDSALKSILSQTYSDWELLIVDDCSTDSTIAIIESYIKISDKIRLIKRTKNSGGARLPRFEGILSARGEYVTHIDADDFIEKEYLEKMVDRMNNTNATIILSKLLYCSADGKIDNRQIPSNDFDFNEIISGKSACLLTLGGWKINLAGLLTKTSFYQNFIKNVYTEDYNSCFNDELDYRKLLISSETVAFSNSMYFYRQQPQSVVHLKASQFVDRINQMVPLYEFISKVFSENKCAISKIQDEYIKYIYVAKCTFEQEKYTIGKSERNNIESKIYKAYNFMKLNGFLGTTFKQKIILRSYRLMNLIIFLRNLYIKIR